MGDGNKSDTDKEQKSGFPKISAMHVIIAVAVIVLAVILIAKFGFNMDLISPSSGEMAIAKQRPVTPGPTLVQNPAIKDTLSSLDNKKSITGAAGVVVTTSSAVTTTTTSSCPAGQAFCGGLSCIDLQTDTDNCGACGKWCYMTGPPNTNDYCYQGKCTWECRDNYRFCGNLKEGCVKMTHDDKHCGNCNTDCGSGSWCNSTHCESGSRPVTRCPFSLVPCEYPNSCKIVVDPVTHELNPVKKCAPP